MTLFSYEIFDAVARQGSFNKAAQQLHLTPSAISHAIAVMEEELGFALFNRGKNGVSMTSYGASLYPSIRDVLNSDEALKQSIARLNGLEKGKVKLGVFNSVCASLLPGLLLQLLALTIALSLRGFARVPDRIQHWRRWLRHNLWLLLPIPILWGSNLLFSILPFSYWGPAPFVAALICYLVVVPLSVRQLH